MEATVFFQDIEKRIQKRYPTVSIRWNGTSKQAELVEKYTAKSGENRIRFLWTFQNHDGTFLPVSYDRCMEWLQKADTRNWHWANRDLFQDCIRGRKQIQEESSRKIREHVEAAIVEDYRYINGVPTFFMDPSNMPEARTTFRPGQKELLRKGGHIL
jgi:hypothetical protein